MTTISIIIPAFNDQAGINILLDALARQSLSPEHFEVIIVDNGSSPPIAVRSFDAFEVRLLHCNKPGSYAARNVGVSAAKGDILAFTDADCRPSSEWLMRGIEALKATNGRGIIGGEVLLNKPSQPTAVALYQCLIGFGQASNAQEKGFSATANLFCGRHHFEVVGLFDSRLLSGGDREWCWRATKRGFFVRYAGDVIVRTDPRNDLRGAIRQARRVAGGRNMISKLGLAHIGDHAVAKPRSPWQSVLWILRHQDMRVIDRWRVFFVALLINAASAWEKLRLTLGFEAERR